MAGNDHAYDMTKPGSGNTGEGEADIVPLQRCPHLYIKYTAAKGKTASNPDNHASNSVVVDPHAYGKP